MERHDTDEMRATKRVNLLQYMRWDSIFAVVPVCVSSFGIILTVVTFAIFYKNRDTPLVRASGRELSYVILSGLLVCYLNTYILLAKPGTIVCLLQRSVDIRTVQYR